MKIVLYGCVVEDVGMYEGSVAWDKTNYPTPLYMVKKYKTIIISNFGINKLSLAALIDYPPAHRNSIALSNSA